MTIRRFAVIFTLTENFGQELHWCHNMTSWQDRLSQ